MQAVDATSLHRGVCLQFICIFLMAKVLHQNPFCVSTLIVLEQLHSLLGSTGTK